MDKACNKTFKNMFAKGESVNIGSIHGFPITAKYQKDLLSVTVFVQATIHGAAKHLLTVSKRLIEKNRETYEVLAK